MRVGSSVVLVVLVACGGGTADSAAPELEDTSTTAGADTATDSEPATDTVTGPGTSPGDDSGAGTTQVDTAGSTSGDTAGTGADTGGADTGSGVTTADTADTGATVPTVTTGPTGLLINELQTKINAANQDANCDGSVDNLEDEFVELVNLGADPIDLDGASIETDAGLVHTWGAGDVLEPGETWVVFGGGTPTLDGTSASAEPWCQQALPVEVHVSVASSGALTMTDTKSAVTIVAADGWVLDSYAYTSETNKGESANRNPDLLAGTTMVQHSFTVGANREMSPGTRVDGTAILQPPPPPRPLPDPCGGGSLLPTPADTGAWDTAGVTPLPDVEVCADGTGDFLDLQSAIDGSADGTIIGLCAGTYGPATATDRVLAIVGLDGAEATVLDGGGSTMLTVSGGELELSQVTFSSVSTVNDVIHGVSASAGAVVTVRDARVVDNVALDGSHVFLAFDSTVVVERTLFEDNRMVTLMTLVGSTVEVRRSLFRYNAFNTALGAGGTLIKTAGASTPTIENCAFYDNIAGFGNPFLSLEGPSLSPTFVNNTLVNNRGAQTLVAVTAAGTGAVQNNVLVGPGNQGLAVWSTTSGWNFAMDYGTPFLGDSVAVTDTVADPLLADAPNGDLTLLAGSVCIDGGNPDVAYDDVDATRNDAGACGGPGGAW